MSEFRGPWFEGWYFKHEEQGDTVALIPARHRDTGGRGSASLQVITREESFVADYPWEAYGPDRRGPWVRLGESRFSPMGCVLDVEKPGLKLRGELRYGPLRGLAWDIMGPFCLVPFMECRHSVQSLGHRVEGELWLNGRRHVFGDGRGYLEGDRGRSFPQRYLWTQCAWGGARPGCVMVSVATIPWCGMEFSGCIASLLLEGRERRLATYLGAKPLLWGGRGVVLRQGKHLLSVQLLEGEARPLRAPYRGNMARTIHESAVCSLRVQYQEAGRRLLDITLDNGSFEYSE